MMRDKKVVVSLHLSSMFILKEHEGGILQESRLKFELGANFVAVFTTSLSCFD